MQVSKPPYIRWFYNGAHLTFPLELSVSIVNPKQVFRKEQKSNYLFDYYYGEMKPNRKQHEQKVIYLKF